MTFDQEMQELGNELINEFGGNTSIAHISGSTSTTKAVMTTPSKQLLAGSSLTTSNKVVWVKGTSANPVDVGDVITIRGASYGVESVRAFSSTGATNVVYAAFVGT
jgi:hypothetical protein